MSSQRGSRRQVGVVEDDVGRFAAQLRHDRCQIRCGRHDDLAGSRAATGEVDLADTRMAGQGIAAFGAGGDHVDQAGRQPCLQAQFAEPQCRQRRELRRLEHHRVSGGQCGRHARGRDGQRTVPRCDDGHDAVGLTFDQVDVERSVDRCTGAVRLVDVAGEMAQESFEQQCRSGERDRHGVVVHVEFGEFVEMLVHEIGQVDEQVAAPVHGQRHPGAVRLPAAGDGAIDLLRTGQRDNDVRLSGRGIDVVVGARRGLRDPLAADQQPRRGDAR